MSIINHHHPCIYISYHLPIDLVTCISAICYIKLQSHWRLSYRQNNFQQISAPLLLPCIKNFHVLLISFKQMCWFFTSFIAWNLQPLWFRVSWPSDDFIGIPRQVDVFLEDIHHQQLLPPEAEACLQGIQDTGKLRLRSIRPNLEYTVKWYVRVCPGVRIDMFWRERIIRFQATTSGARLLITWQPCIHEWNSKTPQRLPKVPTPKNSKTTLKCLNNMNRYQGCDLIW